MGFFLGMSVDGLRGEACVLFGCVGRIFRIIECVRVFMRVYANLPMCVGRRDGGSSWLFPVGEWQIEGEKSVSQVGLQWGRGEVRFGANTSR